MTPTPEETRAVTVKDPFATLPLEFRLSRGVIASSDLAYMQRQAMGLEDAGRACGLLIDKFEDYATCELVWRFTQPQQAKQMKGKETA